MFAGHTEVSTPIQDDPMSRQRHTTVEDIFDEEVSELTSPGDPRNLARFVERFPMEPHRLQKGTTQFEQWQSENVRAGRDEWYPFASESEWETVGWLVANVGQSAIEEYLKLDITKKQSNLSFSSKYKLNKKLNELPTGPDWECETISITGDRVDKHGHAFVEEVELWRRDPVECVCELIGNPAFKDYLAYLPEHVYGDASGENRLYDEMWTAEWWWKIQDEPLNP
ncbi:hypothetical protein PC9H_001838 [Pleurotus ostreatus]|uniref:Uncharacterized protein n=1 Tax=Pleurotus ostreatus TaxID=5322 RepID=A0A8H6ZMA1_PLEOS|nr:uncharacterized protein PC9H_001838 [Pleurotus ostreatus]KAF7419251.1 hypothetical protein PC9H_001838 [Pleurotus ostreatus]